MIQKLYHYTTFNTLALILSSKSIKFGRLDKVNDPTEGKASDFNSLSSYIFVSCWTHNAEEDLALWNMYTPHMCGVRLELNLPIFNSYSIDEFENTLCKKEEYVNEKDKIFILGGKNIPYPIEYTDDTEKLNPKIKTEIGLNTNSLGRHKRKIWAFEQEYRYRIDVLPLNDNTSEKYFPNRYMEFVEKGIPPSIDRYYFQINEESFASMKILVSPKSMPGDMEIVSALVDKYNPTAQVLDSKLRGAIR